MRGVSITRPLLMTLAITYVPVAAADQHEQHAGRALLPEPAVVHFVSSCQQVVAKDFDRAVALLHFFWFSAAITSP